MIDGHSDWRRLTAFLLACVEKESSFASLLSRSSTRGRYVVVGKEVCQLLSGLTYTTQFTRWRSLVAETQQRSESLFVGWPTVIALEPDAVGRQRRKLAPLVLVELQLPPPGQPLPDELSASADPFLHPEVLSQFGLRDESVSELLADYPIDLSQGELGRLAAYANDIAEAVGIPLLEDLDPEGPGEVGEGEIDGPGVRNIALAFRARSAAWHASLIEELRALQTLDPQGSAAGALVGVAASTDDRPYSVVTPVPVSDSQEEALVSALTAPLTVVTGPPGTGKSQLVTATVASCWASNRSVLLASTNNQAVDVVVSRGNQTVEGMVIRTGNREHRDKASELIRRLTDGARESLDESVLRRVAAQSRARIREAKEIFDGQTDAEVAMAAAILTREFLSGRGWNLAPLSDRDDLEALIVEVERLRKSTVELAHAVATEEVARERLLQRAADLMMADPFGIAALSDSKRRRLARRFRRLANARLFAAQRYRRAGAEIDLPSEPLVPREVVELIELSSRFCQARDQLAHHATSQQIEEALLRTTGLDIPVIGVELDEMLDRVASYLSVERDWRSARETERGYGSTGELYRRVIDAVTQHTSDASALIKSLVGQAMHEGRAQLRNYAMARYDWRSQIGPEVEFPKALKFARGWATTSLSTGRVMPLTHGLFDLVIIDEASQCSLASALPLLFRAKRALIIGDPMQLSHIATLTKTMEDAAARLTGVSPDWLVESHLSYKRDSLYRSFEHRTSEVRFLDEHYRSHPDIIGISNKLFYSGALTVLTDPANLVEFGSHAVAWENIPGRVIRPDAGSAYNDIEAIAAIKAVRRLTESLPAGRSIGMVTPFSAQARLLTRLADREIDPEVRRAVSFEVGTAHRFQGDERDVIVFSPVLSEGLADSTHRWLLGTPNLFNVAVTRARSYLLVVGDLESAATMGGFIADFARHVLELKADRLVLEVGAAGELHSTAEERLFRELIREGLDVKPKARVRGYECDFVIGDPQILVNVECDGPQHHDSSGRLRRQDYARDRVLELEGVHVHRVPAWRCLLEPGNVATEIRELVDRVAKPRGA